MALSDPIADLLNRLRNAHAAEHRFVDVRWSKIKENIARLLKEEGYITDYKVKRDGSRGEIRVFLKYTQERKPVIQKIKRVSRPGLRKYVSCEEIPLILGGMGTAVLTTAKGLMTGQKARQERMGGELLCYLW